MELFVLFKKCALFRIIGKTGEVGGLVPTSEMRKLGKLYVTMGFEM